MPSSDHRTPLERYRGDSQFALLACSLKMRVSAACAVQRKAPGKDGDWRGAIVDGQKQARANLAAALRVVTEPAPREALQRYHAVFVAALKGARPGTGERDDAYQARRYANAEAVRAAWMTFEAAHAVGQTQPFKS